MAGVSVRPLRPPEGQRIFNCSSRPNSRCIAKERPCSCGPNAECAPAELPPPYRVLRQQLAQLFDRLAECVLRDENTLHSIPSL